MRLALLLLLLRPAFAREHPNRSLAWSIVAMSAASAADAYTSWHRPEANGILARNGQFGAKGVSIKTGTLIGIALMEYKMRRNERMRGPFIVGNFANAGVSTFAAVHNWRIKK